MISGFTPYAIQQLADAVGGGGGGGGTIVLDFGPLVQALERVQGHLRSIEEAVQNPEATAGDEKLRKGVLAYDNEWWDEARTELEASIAIHPYRARPHLFLGLAHLQLGSNAAALESLCNAVKYGRAEEPRAGIAGALLAAHLYEAIDDKESALGVLGEASHLGVSIPLLAAIQAREPSPERGRLLLRLLEAANTRDWGQYRSLIASAEAERRRQLVSALNALNVVSEPAIDVLRLVNNDASRNVPFRGVLKGYRSTSWERSPALYASNLADMLNQVAGNSTPVSTAEFAEERNPSRDVDAQATLTDILEIGDDARFRTNRLLLRINKEVEGIAFVRSCWADAVAHMEKRRPGWGARSQWKGSIEAAHERQTAVVRYAEASEPRLVTAALACTDALAAWAAATAKPDLPDVVEPLFDMPVMLAPVRTAP